MSLSTLRVSNSEMSNFSQDQGLRSRAVSWENPAVAGHGGVRKYVAQGNPQFDDYLSRPRRGIAEKGHLWMETN